MKTKGEILCDYVPMGSTENGRDCWAQEQVLQAMNEYATQQLAKKDDEIKQIKDAATNNYLKVKELQSQLEHIKESENLDIIKLKEELKDAYDCLEAAKQACDNFKNDIEAMTKDSDELLNKQANPES